MHRPRYVWWGGVLALTLWGATGAHAEEKADALLKKVAATTEATKTLTADLKMSAKEGTNEKKIEGKIQLKKPNMAHIQFGKSFAKVDQVIASDGKTLFTLFNDRNQYMKAAADAKASNIDMMWAFQVGMFFNPQNLGLTKMSEAQAKYVGKETVDGADYEVVELSGTKPFSYTQKLYIDMNSLVTRVTLVARQGDQTANYAATLSNVKTDVKLTAANFAYTPPKTATLFKPPDYTENLIAIGKDAPAFSLPTLKGPSTTLYEAGRGKKAVLVNFWFYG